jgi:hypothetical protein
MNTPKFIKYLLVGATAGFLAGASAVQLARSPKVEQAAPEWVAFKKEYKDTLKKMDEAGIKVALNSNPERGPKGISIIIGQKAVVVNNEGYVHAATYPEFEYLEQYLSKQKIPAEITRRINTLEQRYPKAIGEYNTFTKDELAFRRNLVKKRMLPLTGAGVIAGAGAFALREKLRKRKSSLVPKKPFLRRKR